MDSIQARSSVELARVARRFFRMALICAALAVALSARAQEPPAAGFEGLVEVTEVLLDVLAVDGSGTVVPGLGVDDFEVLENGRPVTITGVSFYVTRYGHDGSLLTADGAVPSSRYYILFFHDRGWGGSISNYLPRQMTKARLGCLTWVEEHLQPSDWVAVVSYDLRLKIHRDFTQDRAVLAEGIESATRRKNPEKGVGRRGRELPPSGAPSLLRNLPQGKELAKETRSFYDGLRLTAEAAGFVVGRKNLVLFTVGFGEFDTSNVVPEADLRYYSPMEHALNDHNVAVYPIDMTPIEIRHSQTTLLNRLAIDTGGRYIRNPISFVSPLKQISEENVGYYLVSYQSEHPADETGYQQVKVRARDPSIKLRARKGYRYGT